MGFRLIKRRTVSVEPVLQNDWAGEVLLTREGNTVWMNVEGLDGKDSTSTTVFVIPYGFRPAGPMSERGLFHQVDGSDPTLRRWWALSALQVTSGTSATLLYGAASWRTTDRMPTGGA